jgi:trehalose-phosphatase
LNKILDTFFEKLPRAESRLLLLDYDGTLAPFQIELDQAFPYDGVEDRLEYLVSSKKTRVIIISGRRIDDLKKLLRLKKLPEIWGSHGWERFSSDGHYSLRPAEKTKIEGLEKAFQFVVNNGFTDYAEKKPVSLAVHFRGVDNDKALEIKKKILHNWETIGPERGLYWSEFDGGIELKVPGFNKGDVVKEIIQNHPADTAVAYLGDDKTDEDAFKVMRNIGLGVLVRKEPRPTAARIIIKPPEELLKFLDRWIEIDKLY